MPAGAAQRAYRVAVEVRNGRYASEHVRGAAQRGESVRAVWQAARRVMSAHVCAQVKCGRTSAPRRHLGSTRTRSRPRPAAMLLCLLRGRRPTLA
jgi:hypothetical protein